MTRFRPEIQALRAVAVMLVVLFHLWPDRIPGGYIGVDVFFVISGYLITAHLIREVDSTGTVSLPSFWARRIRRLLPAAVLVLAATLAATVLFLPGRLWAETARQVGAAAVGIENWVLAASSVDYFGQNNVPSAVQHYWSLSLEEQFYVFWPVLLLVVTIIVRRAGSSRWRFVLGIVMSSVFALSLAWSIVGTALAREVSYFSTFTHGWEFAAGGLLALLTPPLDSSRWSRLTRLRALSTWAGLVAIVVSAFVFTGSSPFPGWIALLPVIGTLAVIAAGVSASRIQKPLFIASSPVQFVGGSSYSTYLWHWPLIVVLPAVLGHELGTLSKAAILVVSIALGWLTRRFVEDPARRSPVLNYRRKITYGIAVVLAGIVVAASGIVWNAGEARASAEQAAAVASIESALDDGNPCFGALAMQNSMDCPASHRVDSRFGPDFAADDWGSIAGVTKDGTLPDKSACSDFSGTGAGYLDCKLGAPDGPVTLAIVGDSHALAVTEPLVRIAESQGWSIRVILRNSCTPSLPQTYQDPNSYLDCNDWRDKLAQRVTDDPSIDLVVTTGFTRGEPIEAFSGTRGDLVEDYAQLWERWADSGKKVLVFEDVPLTSGQSVPDCVAANLAAADPCSVPRDDALVWDPVVDAVAAADDPSISLIDTTDEFCDVTTCHAVIGGLIAYRDPHHLSATFALTLIPRFRAAFAAAGF